MAVQTNEWRKVEMGHSESVALGEERAGLIYNVNITARAGGSHMDTTYTQQLHSQALDLQ